MTLAFADKIDAVGLAIESTSLSPFHGLPITCHSHVCAFPSDGPGCRTLEDCPDPKQLFYFTDIKVARKRTLFYREADAVGVYNAEGKIVEVDDLPEVLFPGSAVIANVFLN